MVVVFEMEDLLRNRGYLFLLALEDGFELEAASLAALKKVMRRLVFKYKETVGR